jgi:hypothetical protein
MGQGLITHAERLNQISERTIGCAYKAGATLDLFICVDSCPFVADSSLQ